MPSCPVALPSALPFHFPSSSSSSSSFYNNLIPGRRRLYHARLTNNASSSNWWYPPELCHSNWKFTHKRRTDHSPNDDDDDILFSWNYYTKLAFSSSISTSTKKNFYPPVLPAFLDPSIEGFSQLLLLLLLFFPLQWTIIVWCSASTTTKKNIINPYWMAWSLALKKGSGLSAPCPIPIPMPGPTDYKRSTVNE